MGDEGGREEGRQAEKMTQVSSLNNSEENAAINSNKNHRRRGWIEGKD